MRKKSPARAPARRAASSHGAMQDELSVVIARCAENASRIERLEFDYATQVRRCGELQAEIDLLKRHPLLRSQK